MTPEEVLAYCLQEVEAGRKTPAECAQLFPHVPELEGQLRDAQSMRALRAVNLSPASRRDLEARLRIEFITRYPPPRQRMQTLRLALSLWPVALAMMLAGLLLSAVVVVPRSLPGEPLYPVKRVAEQAEITLTRSAQLPTLYATLAQRRITELEALFKRQALTLDVFGAQSAEARLFTDASLTSASQLPADTQTEQLREVILRLDQQGAAIARMRAVAPFEFQADLDAVARTIQAQHTTARTQLTGLTVARPTATAAVGGPSPIPTTTVAPTGTSVATQPVVTALPGPTIAPTGTLPPAPTTESATQPAPSQTLPAPTATVGVATSTPAASPTIPAPTATMAPPTITAPAPTATSPGNSACQANNPHSPRYCTPTPAP